MRPPADPPLDPAPQVIPAAAVGWRGWRIARDSEGGLSLVATKRSTEWSGPNHVAVCGDPSARHEPADVPSRDCHCGIYALHEPSIPELLFWGGRVFGIVLGRGQAELHARGWRAEEAQLIALFKLSEPEISSHASELPPAVCELSEPITNSELRELGRRYGVPCLGSAAAAIQWADERGLKRVSAEICAPDLWGPTHVAHERMARAEMQRISRELRQIQRRVQLIWTVSIILSITAIFMITSL